MAETNADQIALIETVTEVRTLLEELMALAEEMKVRQERLGELLVPSEAALKARTEYLDRVMKEQLGRAEDRLARVTDEVQSIARHLNDQMVHMPSRMAEVDGRRWKEMARRERWRTATAVVSMILGGFLAGQAASCRATVPTAATPAQLEEMAPVKSAPASAPASAKRRTAPPAR